MYYIGCVSKEKGNDCGLEKVAEQPSPSVPENVIYRAGATDESKALVRGVEMAKASAMGIEKLSPELRKKIITLVGILTMAAILLSSCGPTPGYETVIPPLTQTTEVRPINTPTKQATASFTPENTVTREPTATPTPPDLPAEFFKQIPGGGYEVRDNGVFAPDATGNMRMWYEKQPDGSFREVYFRYGEPLTEQKKIELANKLVCEKADTCISEVPDSGSIPRSYFEFISTGIVEREAVFDTQTGELKGYFTDVLVVSRDVNQKPVIARGELEVEFLSEPGKNQFRTLKSYDVLEYTAAAEKGERYPILGAEFWQKYLPDGKMRTMMILSGYLLENDGLGPRVEEVFGTIGDKVHLENAFQFAISQGANNESEFILMLFSQF